MQLWMAKHKLIYKFLSKKGAQNIDRYIIYMTNKQLAGSRICWSSGWFCAYHEEPASACWGERIKKNYQLRPVHHHDSKGHRHRRNVCLCWSEFWRTALISRVWGFPFLENLLSFDTFYGVREQCNQERIIWLIDDWSQNQTQTMVKPREPPAVEKPHISDIGMMPQVLTPSSPSLSPRSLSPRSPSGFLTSLTILLPSPVRLCLSFASSSKVFDQFRFLSQLLGAKVTDLCGSKMFFF